MPILRRGPAGPGHQALNLGKHPKGVVAARWLPVNYLLLLLGPAQLWQEIINVGPIIASALAPARQGVVASIIASVLAPARQGAASVAETFLLCLG